VWIPLDCTIHSGIITARDVLTAGQSADVGGSGNKRKPGTTAVLQSGPHQTPKAKADNRSCSRDIAGAVLVIPRARIERPKQPPSGQTRQEHTRAE